ncbi:hypothetical protein [Saccharothrix longispora]|uniref:hypothetical protein n=1 Tax=Saccharothrix longispora TaxID=33920 RepID=UPI0028FD234A|nr:hypothetical protein [Saccharothrix longispora]MBY8850326.1 hypothetical protein [Saccharothrix sp. MB29]MDU0288369.1 hypothetical protein [Saccharothrix longispora]
MRPVGSAGAPDRRRALPGCGGPTGLGALAHTDHPDHRQALEASAAHRSAWLGGYRGVLGFVVPVLRPAPPGVGG